MTSISFNEGNTFVTSLSYHRENSKFDLILPDPFENYSIRLDYCI